MRGSGREGGVGRLERGRGRGRGRGERESREGRMGGAAGKVGLGYLLFRFRMFSFILFFRFN